MSKKITVTKPKLPEIKLKNKAKLILRESLKEQIDYFHSKAGEIEWSGVLLYRIMEGTIDNPSSLVIEATDMHLMDIGDATSTEFDLEFEDVKEIHELHEESDPFKMLENPDKLLRKGMIHTHHSMQAYFSGVDDGELQDNTPNHDMYLSLIVNFDGEYCANLAFIAETSGEYKVVGREEVLTSKENTYLIRIDTDIEVDVKSNVPEHIVDRYEAVKKLNTPVYTPTNIHAKLSTFSKLEFLQRVFKVIDTDANLVHGTIIAREKNLKAMVKKADKIIKKESNTKVEARLEDIRSKLKEFVNTTKPSSQFLSPDLVISYIDESMEYVYDELIKKNTPKDSILYLLIDYLETNEIITYQELYTADSTSTTPNLADRYGYQYGMYDSEYEYWD